MCEYQQPSLEERMRADAITGEARALYRRLKSEQKLYGKLALFFTAIALGFVIGGQDLIGVVVMGMALGCLGNRPKIVPELEELFGGR